jgi:hypothetical protein
MPFDNSFNDNYYWVEHQSFYLNLCTWEVSRPLLPRRDALTQKWIWLRPAMRGTRIVPGLTRPEIYWVDKDKYFIWKLKGNK